MSEGYDWAVTITVPVGRRSRRPRPGLGGIVSMRRAVTLLAILLPLTLIPVTASSYEPRPGVTYNVPPLRTKLLLPLLPSILI